MLFYRLSSTWISQEVGKWLASGLYIWANYNDQPAGWSPQMVVCKGIPPKMPLIQV